MRLLMYLLRIIVIACSLGTVFAGFHTALAPIRKELRFVMGVCATPHIVALTNYVLGIVWPEIPIAVMVFFLPTLLIGYLVWKQHYRIFVEIINIFITIIVKWLKKLLSGPWKWVMVGAVSILGGWFYHTFRWVLPSTLCGYSLRTLWLAATILTFGIAGLGFLVSMLRKSDYFKIPHICQMLWRYAAFVITAAMLITCIGSAYSYAKSPLYGSDECHYAMQARYFVQDRDSLNIDQYTGERYGTVLSDDHGPLWPVYLADAMFFSPDNVSNGTTLESAYLLTAAGMILLIAATGMMFSGSMLGGWLSVVLFLLYRYAMHFPMLGSRDGFRLIGLLLLLILLYAFLARLTHSQASGAKVFSIKDAAVLGLVSFLCANGHGSNIAVMAGIFLAFGFFSICCHIRFRELTLLGAFAGAGTALVLIENIQRYLKTGSFRNYTTLVFEGTPIVEQVRASNAEKEGLSVVLSTITSQEWLLMGIGVAALLYCGWRILSCIAYKIPVFTGDSHNKEIFLMAILCTGMLLPMTGIFDVAGNSFALWFIMQTRYRMYYLMVAAILGGVTITYLIKNNCIKWKALVLRFSMLFICVVSLRTMADYYAFPNAYYFWNERIDHYTEVAQKIEKLADGGNVFLNDRVLAYYFETPPKLMYHEINRPWIIAQSDTEIEAALDALNASVFVFESSNERDYSLLPIYTYLTTSDNVNHFTIPQYHNTDELMHIYVIDR